MKIILESIIISLILVSYSDHKVIKLSGVPDIFTTDKLGNCYTYRDNLLEKISIEGKVIAQYTNYESGKIFVIDASDPMQLVLFYKDFNQLVLLDNKLNQIGKTLNLDVIDLSSVSAVCKSKFFAVWIFDQYEEKLIHYGFNPKGIILTINLDKHKKELGNVEFMIESGNEIFLKGQDKSIWIFDQFGKKINKLDFKVEGEFQLKNNTIIYSSENHVMWFNIKNGTFDSIQVKDFHHFDKIRVENNQFYILNSDSITIIPVG